MTTGLSGINCSIKSNGGDMSKATAARAPSAGALSGAAVIAAATRPRANSASTERFMRVLRRKGDDITVETLPAASWLHFGWSRRACEREYHRCFLLSYGDAPVRGQKPVFLRWRNQSKAMPFIKTDCP